MSTPARFVLSICPVLIALSIGGCDDPLATSDAIPLAIAVSLGIDGSAAAYGKTDAIRVVLRASQTEAVESTLPFEPAGDAPIPVQVEVAPDLVGQAVGIDVELLSAGAAIFTGSGQVTPTIGTPASTDIFLSPVVATVEAGADAGPITAIGSTLQLSAAPTFATGDVVPNVGIGWTALDPGIVSVGPTGLATARAEGIGRVQASAGQASTIIRVTVAAAVVRVDVVPPTANVIVNGTIEFTAVPFDANDTELAGRTATWESSNPGVLAVIAPGVGLAVGPGEAEMVATIEGVEGSAAVTVSEIVPAMPSNLTAGASGTTVSINWEDNADNETGYEVLRALVSSPASGDVGLGVGGAVVIAQLGPNSTSYTDATGLVDAQLEYSVRACNDSGCSAASNVDVVFTVPSAPAGIGITLDFSDETVVVSWPDNSRYETRFQIEYNDNPFAGTPWSIEANVPANSKVYDTGATFYDRWYRVKACNDAGCSAPSPIQSYFG